MNGIEMYQLVARIRAWRRDNPKAELTDAMLLNWKRVRGLISCAEVDTEAKAARWLREARFAIGAWAEVAP
jgi:hypothetical protein